MNRCDSDTRLREKECMNGSPARHTQMRDYRAGQGVRVAPSWALSGLFLDPGLPTIVRP